MGRPRSTRVTKARAAANASEDLRHENELEDVDDGRETVSVESGPVPTAHVGVETISSGVAEPDEGYRLYADESLLDGDWDVEIQIDDDEEEDEEDEDGAGDVDDTDDANDDDESRDDEDLKDRQEATDAEKELPTDSASGERERIRSDSIREECDVESQPRAQRVTSDQVDGVRSIYLRHKGAGGDGIEISRAYARTLSPGQCAGEDLYELNRKVSTFWTQALPTRPREEDKFDGSA